jgi:hypothetical protein
MASGRADSFSYSASNFNKSSFFFPPLEQVNTESLRLMQRDDIQFSRDNTGTRETLMLDELYE